MPNLARMRTVKQCFEFFHKEDPETSISEYYLRTLIKQKKVPVFKTGVKFLVNLDVLINYLSNECVEDEEIPFNNYGQIRKVSE